MDSDPIAAAVEFIAAQRGGHDRVLRSHKRDSVGQCAGCRAQLRLVNWPCTVAALAMQARDLAAARRSRRQPRGAGVPGALGADRASALDDGLSR